MQAGLSTSPVGMWEVITVALSPAPVAPMALVFLLFCLSCSFCLVHRLEVAVKLVCKIEFIYYNTNHV